MRYTKSNLIVQEKRFFVELKVNRGYFYITNFVFIMLIRKEIYFCLFIVILLEFEFTEKISCKLVRVYNQLLCHTHCKTIPLGSVNHMKTLYVLMVYCDILVIKQNILPSNLLLSLLFILNEFNNVFVLVFIELYLIFLICLF